MTQEALAEANFTIHAFGKRAALQGGPWCDSISTVTGH
jgi:hypothetical protein